jgi:hypothetical protein
LANGLVRRTFSVRPDMATIGFDDLMNGEAVLRSVRAEASIELDGTKFKVGGLLGQPIHNYLNPAWLKKMSRDAAAFHLVNMVMGQTVSRFAWKKRQEWLSQDAAWPTPGLSATFRYEPPEGTLEGITVQVHYEIYDGLPVISKWITINNGSRRPVRLNSMIVEEMAFVEPESIVDGPPANFRGSYRRFDAFSDYAFGGDMSPTPDAPAIHWKIDPLYQSQVHYRRETPCLLECSTPLGPDVEIQPDGTFESQRVFELVHDSTDRERRGLAVRRAYRSTACRSPSTQRVRATSRS